MRTLFKGGTVITGRGPKRADVLVEGEKVRQVGRLILTPADRTVDVEGCLLFPGFIDAHTHFDLDVCNTTTADDFTTGKPCGSEGRHHHRHRLRLPQQGGEPAIRSGSLA